MKLEEYLEALRNCPEESVKYNDSGFERDLHILTAELGVYDNWPIQLRADFDKVVRDLNNSMIYKFSKQFNLSSGKRVANFDYIPGTVDLDICNYPFISLESKANRELVERFKQDYNMHIILHHYQEKKIPNVPKERALTLVIEELSKYIKKEKIPACFPKSIGWNHLKDNSKIVYYEPEPIKFGIKTEDLEKYYSVPKGE